MSKKHFIALADALRESRPSHTHDVDELGHGPQTPQYTQWLRDCERIAAVCAASNPAFKRQIWLDYVSA